MKKIHYKPEEVVIEGFDEKKKHKYSKLDKILYLLIILVLGLIFGAYFINKNMKVTADGQILLETFQVAFSQPIIIHEHLKIEGDSVRSGDSLFIYSFSKNGRNIPQKEIETKENDELLRLKSEKRVDEEKLRDIDENLEKLEVEMTESKRQIILGIYPASKLDSLKTVKLILESNRKHYISRIQDLGMKIASLTDALAQESLNSKTIRMGSQEIQTSLNELTNYSYVIGRSGVISTIYQEAGDSLQSAEIIMDIVRFQNPIVFAEFDISQIADVTEGASARISFPDGHSTRCVIERVISQGQQVSKNLDILEDENSVGAILVPIDPVEPHWWFKYRNIGVGVTIEKAL